MIINTGQRTDIPAFYSEWFANRLKEGFVCVRNPYDQTQVTKYTLDPKVVDIISFCTKNPKPMFKYMDLLKDYRQYWFFTITPYGKDIEPNVPDKYELLDSFKELSDMVGPDRICWRYDPILLLGHYNIDYHLRAFEKMSTALEGYTKAVVISFIDLYKKVKKNFPEVSEISKEDRLLVGKRIIDIASSKNMIVRPCGEGDELSPYGADCSGCATIEIYEKAFDLELKAPRTKGARDLCSCYLSCDIGAYNSCMHFCRYCYANDDRSTILTNRQLHDPNSPFLLGGYMDGDRIHEADQRSWIDDQIKFDLFSRL